MRLTQPQKDRLRDLVDGPLEAGVVSEIDPTLAALVRRGLARLEPTLTEGVSHAVATPEGRAVVASAPEPRKKAATGPPTEREQARRWGRRE